MPGIPELLLILAIVLLIFGANKLPAIGDALGRGIKNFRRATHANDELEVNEKAELSAAKQAKLESKEAVEDAELVNKSGD